MDKLPDIFAMEIARRLPVGEFTLSQRRSLARLVGLDLDTPMPPDNIAAITADLDPMTDERPIHRGCVEFDIEISAFGETHKLRCRNLYAMTLREEGGSSTSEPRRVLSHAVSLTQVLIWDFDEVEPQWELLDERVIPPLAVRHIDDLTEAHAMAQEQAGKATNVQD